MKPSSPNKKQFLSFDFYAQAVFSSVALLLALYSMFDTMALAIGLWLVVPVTLYNSISLLVHIFMGSYSKQVSLLRIIHAILGFISVAGILFYIYSGGTIDEGSSFYVISFVPFVFLTSYFIITYLDFKAMKSQVSQE